MNFIETFSSWAKKLTDVGVSIIALGVVLEVLFKGAAIPTSVSFLAQELKVSIKFIC